MDAFIFPGQGSQTVGMGGKLFNEIDEFRAVEGEVDELLGYSIRKLCLEDPDKKLKETQYTQPSMYVVNALHYYKAVSKGLRPRLLAGHSLGEYNALHAAGVIDFLTGLRLVQKRGELMSLIRDGGMAAIVGIRAERVTQIIEENHLTGLDVANFNSQTQTVISGPLDEIARARPFFEKTGATRYLPLPVSAAFHSRYMQQVATSFDRFLSTFSFKDIQIPVISNVTARPYKKGESATNVRELLVKQISSPVQWTQTVLYLTGRGASTFHEIGPGNVLSNLVQQIKQA